MPIDPYFTSAVPVRYKLKRKISKKRLLNPYDKFRKDMKKARKAGNPYLVSGRPCLTGFKPPKKVWDDKRITPPA